MRIVLENERTGRTSVLYAKWHGRVSPQVVRRKRGDLLPPGTEDLPVGVFGETRIYAPREPETSIEITPTEGGGATIRAIRKGEAA